MIEKIRQEMFDALKAGKKERKDALSALLDALLKAEKTQMKPLTEADAAQVIRKEIKQLQDTLEFAEKSRREAAEECTYRIALYKTYLPRELTDEEIIQMIEKIVAENIETDTNQGQIMKNIMPQIKGKANGNRVAYLVSEYLKNYKLKEIV